MRRFTAILLASLMVLSVMVAPAAAENTKTGTGAINEDADSGHDPYINGTVTVATHEMSWDPLEYENDSGDKTSLPAHLNDSKRNPFALTFSDIDTDAYTEFPVNTGTEDTDTWTNATGWKSVTGSGSASEVTTAVNVDAIEVTTNGSLAAGDVASAGYNGYKITSDIDKREVQLVVDVVSIDSGADVFIRQIDTDGDYVEAEIDPDDDASTGNTMANSSGDGYVFQQDVGTLSVTQNGGDGSMGAINETRVVIKDADATIRIAALNVERSSPWKLGERMEDTDGDGDYESVDVRQVNTSGDVTLKSLDSMGGIYSAATIHDLSMPFHAHSSMMPEEEDYERWNVTYSNASDYPSFDKQVDDHRRLMVPTAYDLSYSGLELKDTVPVPDNRYQTAEYATAVGETNFSDVSYTDATSSYSPQDSNVTLATGLSAGTEYAVHYEYVVTGAEFDALSSTGGGGAPMDDSSGGGIGGIPIIGGVLVSILAWLGLRDGGG